MNAPEWSTHRLRFATLVLLVVALAMAVLGTAVGDERVALLADVLFAVAIVAFGLVVRVVLAGENRLLRVSGSLLIASGLAEAYLLTDPTGPITPFVPNLLFIGGAVLYIWTRVAEPS